LVAAFLFLMTSPAVSQDVAGGSKRPSPSDRQRRPDAVKIKRLFRDAAVKILMPDKMQKAAEVLKKRATKKRSTNSSSA